MSHGLGVTGHYAALAQYQGLMRVPLVECIPILMKFIIFIHFLSDEDTCSRFAKLFSTQALSDYKSLDSVFGRDWYLFFHNKEGDFSYIVPKTLKVTAKETERADIVYSNGELVDKISRNYFIIVQFVKGESNLDGFHKGTQFTV